MCACIYTRTHAHTYTCTQYYMSQLTGPFLPYIEYDTYKYTCIHTYTHNQLNNTFKIEVRRTPNTVIRCSHVTVLHKTTPYTPAKKGQTESRAEAKSAAVL